MTLLINTQAISKSYSTTPLFSDISLGISAQERLGLIGPNGAGKSTLLKILKGLETPDSGKVILNAATRMVYLAQEDAFDATQTIKDILFATLTEPLEEAEYQYLIWQVTGEETFADLNQKVGALSGGWRKRLAIVQALLQKPDLLLMDEPTNHLDLAGIVWLENLIKKNRFAFVLVSHDRYFLESTINTVVELNKVYPAGYFKSAGNYSSFLEKRAAFIEGQIQKEQSLSNQMRREQEWLQRMPKARTTKAQYRIDKAEKLRADLSKIKTSNAQTKKAAIDFEATHRQTKILLEAQQLSLSRNGKLLFSQLDLQLSPGTCLGLMGKNGSGKSSLMHLLTGDILPDTGTIKRAENLRMVVFDQKREQLNQQQTLMQALSLSGDHVFYKGASIHVASWAKRFLFTPDQLQQPVSRLSGGEQARVLIANLMLQPADILLLDEPTNDLDIPTLEILEESLSEFPGAIVLITHDRYLLDRLSDRLLYIEGNGKTEFFADYAQWQQTMRDIQTPLPVATKTKKPKQADQNAQRELARLPEKIQKAEAELEVLQAQLEHTEVSNNPKRLTEVCEKIAAVKNKIEGFYARWEELEQ
jgi:ATP-binding cassette subfamily F protein uup